MNKCVPVYKPVGLTPFDTVRILKQKNPDLNNIPVSYAGRLDPMAEGVLLILTGNENKKRKIYERLPKTYEFTMVLGLETDSCDTLGILKSLTPKPPPEDVKGKMELLIPKYTGQFIQKYPPYSAAKYRGKPLYYWSRRGLYPDDNWPAHVIGVNSLKLLKINTQKLDRDMIMGNINKVRGDFRQKEITKRWASYFNGNPVCPLTHLSFRISCLSGTYIRQLVSDMGQDLGSGAFTLKILRTSAGKYDFSHSVKII